MGGGLISYIFVTVTDDSWQLEPMAQMLHTFLKVPLLGINHTYQMVAHHSCVVQYPLMTICPYCEQVEDIEH